MRLFKPVIKPALLLAGLVLLCVFASSITNLQQERLNIDEGAADSLALQVRLGKMLFYEKAMSRDSSLSCGSCHQQKLAFTDGLKTSRGFKGQFVKRNAPTLTNVKNQKSFLRDGVNPSLETQVLVPIQEHDEFDFHILLIAERLKMDSTYVRLSKMAFSRAPDPYVITHSIAAFERTLVSNDSPFDHFRKGDSLALNESELRGMHLFINQLYCGECHNGPDLTNHEFANNGLFLAYKDTGRMRLTRRERDRAVFKVPTLRNIGLTGPYMHNGSFTTLEEVIEHYRAGGKAHVNKSAIIQPFEITKEEKTDLIHFLQSLTDLDFVNNSAYSP